MISLSVSFYFINLKEFCITKNCHKYQIWNCVIKKKEL